jgi:TPR repeat protein
MIPASDTAPSDFDKRLALLESGQGDRRDMFYVGWHYLNGQDVPQDVDKGLIWLDRAAELGDTEAIAQLAETYEIGRFVSLDCAKARAYYASLDGAPGYIASYSLAFAYYWGSECMPRNEALAYKYFSLAAKDGHLVSEAILSQLMRTGRYGFRNRLLGYLLPIRSIWKMLGIILLNRPDGGLWDARRWLPNQGIYGKLRKGTRFE